MDHKTRSSVGRLNVAVLVLAALGASATVAGIFEMLEIKKVPVPRRWSWIERDAAWLVYDADGAGRITSALQWFGNVTFWLFWENGYDALRALDDDGDRQLTGTGLRHLALWHDANQNGFSEPGEVRPLSAHGIVAISCEHVRGDGSILAAESRAGVTFADGRTRPTYDVILRAAGTGTTLSAPVN